MGYLLELGYTIYDYPLIFIAIIAIFVLLAFLVKFAYKKIPSSPYYPGKIERIATLVALGTAFLRFTSYFGTINPINEYFYDISAEYFERIFNIPSAHRLLFAIVELAIFVLFTLYVFGGTKLKNIQKFLCIIPCGFVLLILFEFWGLFELFSAYAESSGRDIANIVEDALIHNGVLVGWLIIVLICFIPLFLLYSRLNHQKNCRRLSAVALGISTAVLCLLQNYDGWYINIFFIFNSEGMLFSFIINTLPTVVMAFVLGRMYYSQNMETTILTNPMLAMQQLESQLDSGQITEEEYAAKRAEIISKL